MFKFDLDVFFVLRADFVKVCYVIFKERFLGEKGEKIQLDLVDILERNEYFFGSFQKKIRLFFMKIC